MTWLALSLKRLSHSGIFLMSFLLMALVIIGSGLSDKAYAGLVAGYTVPSEGGALSERLECGLGKYGIQKYETAEELEKAVQYGEIDCGILFPPDLETRMENVDFMNSITLLISPSSQTYTMFVQAVSAELLAVSAPYLNFPILDELVPEHGLKEEILLNYQDMMENGNGFVFQLETVEGEVVKDIPFSYSFTSVMISLFLFVIPLMQGCRIYQKNYKGIASRIGKKTARYTVFYPEMLVTLLVEILVLTVSLFVAIQISGVEDLKGLFFPSISAAVILCVFSTALVLLCKSGDAIQICMIPIILLTLLVCPLLFDIEAAFPSIQYIRLLLPTYWLIGIAEYPVIGYPLLGVGVSAVLATVIISTKRCRP